MICYEIWTNTTRPRYGHKGGNQYSKQSSSRAFSSKQSESFVSGLSQQDQEYLYF